MSCSHETMFSILENFISRLDAFREQLNDDTSSRQNDNLNTDEFWNNFDGSAKLVSHEATKIGMMFSEENLPSNSVCQSLMNSLESRCLALLAIFFTFPKSRGKTVHKNLRVFVETVLLAVQDLCTEVQERRFHRLTSVGNVWKECESIKDLPRENKSAVTSLIHDQLLIVQDALKELQENMENKNEEEPDEETLPLDDSLGMDPFPKWTEADLQLLPPSIGLIKTVKACLKRTNSAISSRGNVDSVISISQLDDVGEICKVSSAIVDDFVMSLYPPIEYFGLREQASVLTENCKKLLATVIASHFCTEEDKTSWITFLQTAVDHNSRKVADLIQERLTED